MLPCDEERGVNLAPCPYSKQDACLVLGRSIARGQMSAKLGCWKHKKGNNWLKPARIFFALLSRGFGGITTNPPPTPQKYNLQWVFILHQLILALQNASGLLELICITGVIFPYIGLRMGGWGSVSPPPLSQIRKSLLSLDFFCGQSCKNLSSTSARLLSGSCPKFLGKARRF